MSVEPDVDIKQELDIGEDSAGAGGYHETPRSWDSGVALDSVTALQMAEFQQVQSTRHGISGIFSGYFRDGKHHKEQETFFIFQP